jgi:hypothetical protein
LAGISFCVFYGWWLDSDRNGFSGFMLLGTTRPFIIWISRSRFYIY